MTAQDRNMEVEKPVGRFYQTTDVDIADKEIIMMAISAWGINNSYSPFFDLSSLKYIIASSGLHSVQRRDVNEYELHHFFLSGIDWA